MTQSLPTYDGDPSKQDAACIAEMYDEYFWSVMNIVTGGGWYEPKPERENLDWLTKVYPA